MSFKIVRDDITKVKAEIIVNSAHPKPKYSKGIDTAIYLAAGEEDLLQARLKIGDIEVGEIAVTPAFKLSAKYIIHTVGPFYEFGADSEIKKLYSCYEKSLKKAIELDCKSIAFPLISSGCFGFPKQIALKVASNAITDFLLNNELDVILVVFDEESYALAEKISYEVKVCIDKDTIKEQTNTEYGFGYDAQEHNKRIKNKLSQEAGNSDMKIFQRGETFQECLFRYADEKGVSDVELYKKANIDRKVLSKIKCKKDYTPKKNKVCAFAIALELNWEETKELLASAGGGFSDDVFDRIIEYFIKEKNYDIMTINQKLNDHGQELLE